MINVYVLAIFFPFDEISDVQTGLRTQNTWLQGDLWKTGFA